MSYFKTISDHIYIYSSFSTLLKGHAQYRLMLAEPKLRSHHDPALFVDCNIIMLYSSSVILYAECGTKWSTNHQIVNAQWIYSTYIYHIHCSMMQSTLSSLSLLYGRKTMPSTTTTKTATKTTSKTTSKTTTKRKRLLPKFCTIWIAILLVFLLWRGKILYDGVSTWPSIQQQLQQQGIGTTQYFDYLCRRQDDGNSTPLPLTVPLTCSNATHTTTDSYKNISMSPI